MSEMLAGLVATGEKAAVLLAPALFLGFALHLAATLLEGSARRLMGWRNYMLVLGGPGTVVHELSHAVMCVVCGHRIVEVKFFDPNTRGGLAGYVHHHYDPTNPFQLAGNFFIGTAPLLLGAVVLEYLVKWVLGEELLMSLPRVPGPQEGAGAGDYLLGTAQALVAYVQALPDWLLDGERLGDWRLYLLLYLLVSIGSAMRLSPLDLANAGSGLAVLVLALGLANFVAGWLLEIDITRGLKEMEPYVSALYPVLTLAIALNLLVAVPFVVALALLAMVRAIAAPLRRLTSAQERAPGSWPQGAQPPERWRWITRPSENGRRRCQ